MDIDNNPRAHCDPISGDCSYHLDRPSHRGIEAGLIPFSFSLLLGSCYSKHEAGSLTAGELGCQDNSRVHLAFRFTTRTRKSGRGTGHWDFNLQILVPYRKTFF